MRAISNKFAQLRLACAAAFCGAVGLVGSACNDHPVEKLNSVLTAVNSQTTQLPAKTKIDFLFVVDNSGSMCQEQQNLTKNFGFFSDFLFDELGDAADYRLAIISTDMTETNKELGRFLRKPAEHTPSMNCRDGDEYLAPDTAHCFDANGNILSSLPTIIRSDDPQIQTKEDLNAIFTCLATLGTRGDGFEKGLESMRVSLSCAADACLAACYNAGGSEEDCYINCRAPNSKLFGKCCKPDGTYDPACVIGENDEEPEFLRPDAMLVVIFISDEDDCSDPSANYAASKRAICKYGVGDSDGDGIPDGYRDSSLCHRSPQECFVRECGAPGNGESYADRAKACYKQRCDIGRDNNSACEWYRDDLTPVADYYDFLTSLKGQPIEQLVLATIVGNRAYTSDGNSPIFFNYGTPTEACCTSYTGGICVDQEHNEVCCPDGICQGVPNASCKSSNGEAFAGKRYLELAELFEANGIGCPAGKEGDEAECVTICQDDFASPLKAIRDRIIRILATYCLDQAPTCQVSATRDEEGNVVPARPCETAEEFANINNYLILVRKACTTSVADGGLCQEVVPSRILCPGPNCTPDPKFPGDEWELVLNEPSCPGNALIRLLYTPEAGSEVSIEFLAGEGSVAAITGQEQSDAGVSDSSNAAK